MSDFQDDPRLAALMRGAAADVADVGSGPEETRRRAQRHRTQRAAAAGLAVGVIGLAGLSAAFLQESPASTLRVTGTPSPTPSPSATPSTTPAAPTAEPQRLVLNGDDLGVTEVGEPYAAAVQAVTEVLGAPSTTSRGARCLGADREVEWDSFRLAFRGGALAGWYSSTPELRTPSGVGVDTTVATLQRVYGQRLKLYPANPDNPEGFAVSGVNLFGDLTGLAAADRVTGLYNGFCGGP